MRVLELNSVAFFILPLLLNSCSLCFYFVSCRKLSMISQNLQYVVEFLQNRWFVEHLSEFCRNSFCYFQLPCFHFHITLFKQILKSDLKVSIENRFIFCKNVDVWLENELKSHFGEKTVFQFISAVSTPIFATKYALESS